ncbi:DUF4392 domain-containing protein [Rhodobacteraceae bacterium KMM 6894]|nr:DUF4392 domain-containing protein [Rhodobacteraceae bacterium KMM 6894]
MIKPGQQLGNTQAAIARADKSLATIVMLPFATGDDTGKVQAVQMLDDLKPDLLFSTERVGRNDKGVYHSMRGIDYGMGRARIDLLFDEGLAEASRWLPLATVAMKSAWSAWPIMSKRMCLMAMSANAVAAGALALLLAVMCW